MATTGVCIYRMVGDDGTDEWAPDENGPHARVAEKLSKAEVVRIIDELMLRMPKVICFGHLPRRMFRDDQHVGQPD